MTRTTTVGDLARLAGVTVRTLHHYDDIALLTPSERRSNGYRGYADTDVARLQQILASRELGLGLDEIARILDEPTGTAETLVKARERIEQRIDKLRHIATGLDAAISAETQGTTMTPEERLEAFGNFDPDEFAAEAQERWGSTDAYAESARRTSTYAPRDWRRRRSEADDLDQRFLALIDAGVAADSEEAAALVDAHRAHITKWFYACSPEIHAGLGTMYAADGRFTSNIDKAGEGLAGYLSAAIEARYDD
ncbi:MAG: TipAS antibiotic-recognition domain-containing protein [Actinomycetota bacterium]|nr:TipAS antibiotic-recognition domain-containing protein [Actinomycetota bacterium]